MKLLKSAIIILMLTSMPVKAGEHATALSQCLENNTSEEDRNVMIKWVFMSLSNHPSITSMANISNEATMATNQQMTKLIERFMYENCFDQLKTALQSEGPKAIELSIRSYAEVAGRDLLQHPSVSGSVTGLAQHFDLKRLFEALLTQ
ncbi:MAG: hypothetical protein HOM01_11420 [Kordiimonadaceae bacterium]|mgnify:CR=1 FL=1|jgi:hypothetical protein|nr:hypothetical protein [Kordiimonadaceae bacterium]